MDSTELEPRPEGAEEQPAAEAPGETATIEEVPAPEFELIGESGTDVPVVPEEALPASELELRATIEAVVFVAEEPLAVEQLAAALARPVTVVRAILDSLSAEYDRPEHGVMLRQVAGGYKFATKPEHHEAIRAFVKSLKPPMKLSLAALETLAVIAYKQPVTAPEIMEIRGVQGAGVLKTLLDRKLIAAAGRKNVIGKPVLYKTTKDFLVQFGLKDLGELPTLKEFEELRRLAINDEPEESEAASPAAEAASAEPERAVPAPAGEMPGDTASSAAAVAGESASAEPAPAAGTMEGIADGPPQDA